MNKVHEKWMLRILSDAIVAVHLPHTGGNADSQKRLDTNLHLLAMLVWHRVIPHTPEELADIAVADLRVVINHLFAAAPLSAMHLAESKLREMVIKVLADAHRIYESDLRKAGIDPEKLPKIPLPAYPLPDVELLLDNAATASQVRELLRDEAGGETALREAVRRAVYEPLAKLLR